MNEGQLIPPKRRPSRRCVGVALLNEDEHTFIGQKSLADFINADRQFDYEMIQGAPEFGETIAEAAQREIRQEIGNEHSVLLAGLPGQFQYHFEYVKNRRSRYRGQTQDWVIAYYFGKDADIDLNTQARTEFLGYMWATAGEVLQRAPNDRKEIYSLVRQAMTPIYQSLQLFRDIGMKRPTNIQEALLFRYKLCELPPMKHAFENNLLVRPEALNQIQFTELTIP